jgi:ferrous iron transport protein A
MIFGGDFMPLAMADMGVSYTIKTVTGSDKTKHHLQTLGFTPGAEVIVVASLNGNFIVNVRETRIAIDRGMANKILLS